MDIEPIPARYRRCPNECRPITAAAFSERDDGYKVTRRLSCPSCDIRWTQHRYT